MIDAEETKALEEFRKLEKQGIFGLPPVSVDDMPSRRIAVRIRTALVKNADVKALQWNIEIVNQRGASIVLSDWQVYDDAVSDQRILSFTASMQLPDNVTLPGNPEIACAFADLCWFQGNEAVKPEHESEVVTKKHSNVPYNDIGWFLPCRFADRLVDALGKANDTLLSGVLEDAMLYGVSVSEGKKS